MPPLEFPADLPITSRRDDIAAAIANHQVVVIAGETGSGKTTQLPKICLELGRGVAGMIGHTQPRRIAARSVAERLCDELGVPLGGPVGYQVRFTDESGPDTLVEVMTDGVLLAELGRDPQLSRYDTIIVDEAHERSLTIDFVLGYVTRLLSQRPDLKLIVTSATIDPAGFAAHFARHGIPAEVVEVSGRTYPVEIRYRPLAGRTPAEDRDQLTGICDAVEELWTESVPTGPADILVFLSGEREIRDAVDAVAGLGLPDTEVLPLYGRLSAAEQHRIFAAHRGRRVILATNVAETSLTVPGIRYVVDTGTARISRYSQRTKVQRLPIEPISRASADQRSGRCGRLADGVAIRLYAEDDYEARPRLTDPEITRTSLAAVLLQMAWLRLGDVDDFPFLDRPDPRQITDAVRLLQELHAVEPEPGASARRRRGAPVLLGRLTPTGRAMARLPVDPRLARMAVEAGRLGCLTDVLVVVAALSIQDPRERPTEKQQQADRAHRRFAHETSDILGYLSLWHYLQAQQAELSSSAFRRLCTAEFLHYLRIREWQDLVGQLRHACRSAGLAAGRGHPSSAVARDGTVDRARADALHQAVLAGLLSHVGMRDPARRDYLGARGARFSLSFGSAVAKRPPDYVMAADLVDTGRLWARAVARIDPAWAEQLGEHLVVRQYSHPRWSARRGAAVATERVTLYGVPLVADRTVGYARIHPEEARELFIRHGLVEGAWDARHDFLRDNAQLLRQVEDMQTRTRRRDLVVDDDRLAAFYDERLPAEVVSARHFERWWKRAGRDDPRLLHLTQEALLAGSPEPDRAELFPDTWRHGDLDLPLSYRFEPGHGDDGVTVTVRADQLNQLGEAGFDWLVPGLREEVVHALLRTLPKQLRRRLHPMPEHAELIVRTLRERGLGPSDGPLTDVLQRVLRQTHGVRIEASDWGTEKLPAHLRMTIRVTGADGTDVARSDDVSAVHRLAAAQSAREVARAGSDVERAGLTSWSIGDLPSQYVTDVQGRQVIGYPALVDEAETAALRVLADAADAAAAHRAGVRRLLLLAAPRSPSAALARLDTAGRLTLGQSPYPSVQALLADCAAAAVDSVLAETAIEVPRTAAAFQEALAAVSAQLSDRQAEVLAHVVPVLAERTTVLARAAALGDGPLREVVEDEERHIARLLPEGFVGAVGADRLDDLVRYLRAAGQRLDGAARNPVRDRQLRQQVDGVTRQLAELRASTASAGRADDRLEAIGWMIEELRVSLFAQRLGTRFPVSVTRIERAMAELAGR